MIEVDLSYVPKVQDQGIIFGGGFLCVSCMAEGQREAIHERKPDTKLTASSPFGISINQS